VSAAYCGHITSVAETQGRTEGVEGGRSKEGGLRMTRGKSSLRQQGVDVWWPMAQYLVLSLVMMKTPWTEAPINTLSLQ